MADALEQAIGRVQEAMDRVLAAWGGAHPDLPVHTREPRPPAWYPDPHQAPVTTRQWAEVTRLRASAPRQRGRSAPVARWTRPCPDAPRPERFGHPDLAEHVAARRLGTASDLVDPPDPAAATG